MRNWLKKLFSNRSRIPEGASKESPRIFISSSDSKGPPPPDRNGKNYRFYRLTDDGDYVYRGLVRLGPTSEAERDAELRDIIQSGLGRFGTAGRADDW